MERHKVLVLQITCNTINACSLKEIVDVEFKKTFLKINAQIRALKTFIGQDLKLVVLPEYFLMGFPMGKTIEQWREKACAKMNGWEYEELGENFRISFIISPEGKVTLRYRRLNSVFIWRTNPQPDSTLWILKRRSSTI